MTRSIIRTATTAIAIAALAAPTALARPADMPPAVAKAAAAAQQQDRARAAADEIPEAAGAGRAGQPAAGTAAAGQAAADSGHRLDHDRLGIAGRSGHRRHRRHRRAARATPRAHASPPNHHGTGMPASGRRPRPAARCRRRWRATTWAAANARTERRFYPLTVTLNTRLTVAPLASVSRNVKPKVPAVVGVPPTRTSGPDGLSWMSDIPGGNWPAVRAQR